MPKRILIIEDEEYLSDMYKMKFEEEGYEVIMANDGASGIKVAKKCEPDLILLDLVLPEMNGYEVLKILRADKKTKDIKIYILSNLGQNYEIKKGLESGADGYLVKANLTPTQLVENIEKIFSGGKVGIKNQGLIRKEKKIDDISNEALKNDGPKVLLIEDEGAIVEMYKLRLEKENYQVEIARNGAWGIKLAKEKDFDIIIMDMVMPAMDGCEAIKQIKKDKKINKVPIIVLSNSAQDGDIERAKKCGANSYLLKSQITPARLAKEIKRVLKG